MSSKIYLFFISVFSLLGNANDTPFHIFRCYYGNSNQFFELKFANAPIEETVKWCPKNNTSITFNKKQKSEVQIAIQTGGALSAKSYHFTAPLDTNRISFTLSEREPTNLFIKEKISLKCVK